MEGTDEPVTLTLDEISANLLEKMKKAAEGLEEKDTKMEYSDDEEGDEESEKTKKTEDETRQGDPAVKTPLSYAKATSANTGSGGFRPLLKNTLLCNLQGRASMLDVLLAIEKENLDEEMEGVQLIRGNRMLELVMKTERAKNSILETGLTIGGQHCRFFNSTPSRLPSRRVAVSILGLPLEAKNFTVGQKLQEMGYGKHLYTRPVMKKTPTKGTPYYSGILVAVMEDIKTPVPHFITLFGYRVRAIHNGQPARTPRQEVRTAEEVVPQQTPEAVLVKESLAAAKRLAEEVIEYEVTEIVTEVTHEAKDVEKKPVQQQDVEVVDAEVEVTEQVESTDEKMTEESEAEKALFKTFNKKKRRQIRKERGDLRKKRISESPDSTEKAG